MVVYDVKVVVVSVVDMEICATLIESLLFWGVESQTVIAIHFK